MKYQRDHQNQKALFFFVQGEEAPQCSCRQSTERKGDHREIQEHRQKLFQAYSSVTVYRSVAALTKCLIKDEGFKCSHTSMRVSAPQI